MLKGLIFILLSITTFFSHAAVVFHTGKVTNLRAIHWAEDRVCIQIENKWFKLDLSTEIGKATYSLALTAYTTNKDVRAAWLDSSELEGGCDTGTTMNPLYNFQFNQQ